MSEAHIRLDDVRVRYGSTLALEALSLDVARGEVLVLLGHSGCGKSTALQVVNRMVEPESGAAYIDGTDISTVDPVQLRRGIGYVIQQVGLFPHRTVGANVGTVCNLLGWPKARARARVQEMLRMVNLDPDVYSDRYPHQLSGGQQQRVGVARALAAAPDILLMDEPFGALDPVLRRDLQSEFRSWVAELGTTVVFVTHDVDEAVMLADRIAVMSSGGHLHQVGSPLDVLLHPADEVVASFVGSDRVVRALQLLSVSALGLAPASGSATAGGARAMTTDTAYDVLQLLLASDGPVRIDAADGRPLGELNWQGLRSAVAKLIGGAAST